MAQQTPRTMQEILEGLSKTTIEKWLGQASGQLVYIKGLMDCSETNLSKLVERRTEYHTTVWAIRALETELARRDELAEANRKALGLDQPDLGESLWLEGYGEQLDPDQERRLAAQKRIREKLDKLPPMVTPPKDDPRWTEIKLRPEKGDRVRVVFQDFDVLASGPSSLLLKEALPPVVETRKRACGNCAFFIKGDKARGQKPDFGQCGKFHTPEHVSSICSYFDPLPLPQTPPAEAVAVAESLINVCGNCAHHSHRQEPAGFCSKFGCKMPPSNPVDPCVHFRSKPASERAIAALDSIPTPEEFDPNDPRR